VEPAGGACTTTDSPHFEILVVTLSPAESVEISSIGRLVCVERVLVSAGAELVATLVHLRA